MSIIYKGQTIDTAGKDATINGVNNLTVEAGNGVDITQDGDILTINATGGGSGGGSNYAIAITFDSAFLGQPYTVTGPEEETHTGTVPDSLQETVPVYHGGSEYTVSSTDASGKESSATVLVGSLFGEYSVELTAASIYGVTWDGTSTTKWTRTDDAAGFTDPVPYVANASNYGSPFDNLQPWAGMVKSERTAGTMVAIPKFWYQLTQNTPGTPSSGMTIRIADGPIEGFSTSPAHMDRGDGKGERDVVYVGRYHCADDFKSKAGVLPKVNATRADFRAGIHTLGENIWQWDFAAHFTIWLLYLVEFADWNSQACIGYGCGDGSGTDKMGKSDAMPYHTGTVQAERTTYGAGVPYRNIEGLWDNVYDWVDGCYNNADGLNVVLNPNNFANGDNQNGGTLVGTCTSGYPSKFSVQTGGFPCFTPTEENGGPTTYSCDGWIFDKSKPCLYIGGNYNQYDNQGLFSVSENGASYYYNGLGSRLMELPT